MKEKHYKHYPRQRGSRYGLQPGLYLVDATGHRTRLIVTGLSLETLSNRVTIGNAEFQVPEGKISLLTKTISVVGGPYE
ncbi:MAG: hypothetical protein ACLRX6_03315 [Limosilactobacillus pontis]|uniref:hypothetical protein n=1 Tax=Limosilactobacillus pontis TaxID=35787 RepID=UPI0039A216BE